MNFTSFKHVNKSEFQVMHG